MAVSTQGLTSLVTCDLLTAEAVGSWRRPTSGEPDQVDVDEVSPNTSQDQLESAFQVRTVRGSLSEHYSFFNQVAPKMKAEEDVQGEAAKQNYLPSLLPSLAFGLKCWGLGVSKYSVLLVEQ